MKKVIVLAFVALGVGQAYALENSATKFNCTAQNGETRTIEVEYKVEGQKVPCEVVDVQGSNVKKQYNAQSTEGYCESKAEEYFNSLVSRGICNVKEEAEPQKEQTSVPAPAVKQATRHASAAPAPVEPASADIAAPSQATDAPADTTTPSSTETHK